MNEKTKKILETWEKMLPKMSDQAVERFTDFMNGAAAMQEMMQRQEPQEK